MNRYSFGCVICTDTSGSKEFFDTRHMGGNIHENKLECAQKPVEIIFRFASNTHKKLYKATGGTQAEPYAQAAHQRIHSVM